MKQRQTTPPALLCLEGEWEPDPFDKISVEHTLKLLELQRYLRLVHRNVNTVEELSHHIGTMTQQGKPRYSVIYLGFHGSKAGIQVGDQTVSLDELATELSRQQQGFVVYFASCGVLRADAEKLMSFCRKSGARAVAGYTRDVDWVESSAFELLMLSSLLVTANIKPLHNRLVRDHPILSSKLGFRMAHTTWASEIA